MVNQYKAGLGVVCMMDLIDVLLFKRMENVNGKKYVVQSRILFLIIVERGAGRMGLSWILIGSLIFWVSGLSARRVSKGGNTL
ncbi:Protein of unknown function [Pyronema omphalodes CBS 100304]|uniref:Uncharacterized protein n=1 Tax=Pyronema omphalodes (strain CBS 100304) TaxID=1076935 RepID=U4L6C9_PYROM|nr:Protein of unknown function [Pyronema omphalodes CBS 100304]